MDSTRDAIDLRSPKRQALMSTFINSLDVGIWTSIIEFLPIPDKIEPDLVLLANGQVDWAGKRKHYDTAVSEIVVTWRTLLNLRLVSKELAELLHPVDNRALWKRLLLQSFDFSIGGSFNVENFQEDHCVGDVSEDEEIVDWDSDEAAAVRRRNTDRAQARADLQNSENPQLVAMAGRYDDMPPNYLEEDLVEWSKLGIYHRPSQYGFLTTLQQQPAQGEWPESEDPFSLFSDLVRLLVLPHGERMVGGGEGSDTTFKYLAAPTQVVSSSLFYRFHVMKTLGYVPHFWHRGSGISGEWKGFSEPERLEEIISEQLFDKHGNDNRDVGFEDNENIFDFPDSNVADIKQLYQHVRQHCQDWRSVCCNQGSDGETPVFFVGESKALPHRWIGYMGEKCWT